ncbi:ANR family transcriptional regulator [Serratia marcescens]|uniref:ANR family transcriptional regulator n=1 Tax=Serratia marcescens TaxID=615 RepID=UPI00396C96E4
MVLPQESVCVSGESKIAPVSESATDELVAVMFLHESPREQFRQMSTRAAQLERNGHYEEAMCAWMRAAVQAPSNVDLHWCESRAQWCERRMYRIVNEDEGRERKRNGRR